MRFRSLFAVISFAKIVMESTLTAEYIGDRYVRLNGCVLGLWQNKTIFSPPPSPPPSISLFIWLSLQFICTRKESNHILVRPVVWNFSQLQIFFDHYVVEETRNVIQDAFRFYARTPDRLKYGIELCRLHGNLSGIGPKCGANVENEVCVITVFQLVVRWKLAFGPTMG